MFSSVDGGRSQISSSGTSQGGRRRHFYNVDGGRSQISSSGTASQGACRRRFTALMVGALGPPALAPLPDL
jgi:hypothetical protein